METNKGRGTRIEATDCAIVHNRGGDCWACGSKNIDRGNLFCVGHRQTGKPFCVDCAVVLAPGLYRVLYLRDAAMSAYTAFSRLIGISSVAGKDIDGPFPPPHRGRLSAPSANEQAEARRKYGDD